MAKSATIHVVKIEPGKAPEIKCIPNEYEAIRDEVGGGITTTRGPAGTTLYCPDEALLECLPWNAIVLGQPLAGNIVLTGAPDEEGYDTDLGSDGSEMVRWFNENTLRLMPVPSSIDQLERVTGRPAMEIQPWDPTPAK